MGLCLNFPGSRDWRGVHRPDPRLPGPLRAGGTLLFGTQGTGSSRASCLCLEHSRIRSLKTNLNNMHLDVSMLITQASPDCERGLSLAVTRKRRQSVLTPGAALWPGGGGSVAVGPWCHPPPRICPAQTSVAQSPAPHMRDVHPPAGQLRPHEGERVPGVWTRSGAIRAPRYRSPVRCWLRQNCCFLTKQSICGSLECAVGPSG